MKSFRVINTENGKFISLSVNSECAIKLCYKLNKIAGYLKYKVVEVHAILDKVILNNKD